MAADPVCGMKVDDKNPQHQMHFGERQSKLE